MGVEITGIIVNFVGNIIEFKDTDEGVHIGKCKDCEYELTQEHTYNEEGLCIRCGKLGNRTFYIALQ